MNLRPALGLKHVRWYKRQRESGTLTYVVTFTDRQRRPTRKWKTLKSSVRAAAQKEAYELGQQWHLGLYDP